MEKLKIENSVQEIVNGKIRVSWFTPAWNKTDPDPNKNYGISCVKLNFGLVGEEGAISCYFFSNLYLLKDQGNASPHYEGMNRLGDISSHKREPQWENQFPIKDCQLLNGDCYSDGSSLQGGELFELFISEGLNALWEKLEMYYRAWILDEVGVWNN